MTPVVLIPARMASTRLPGKPLADIAGKPMIVQVCLRAREAGFADIIVATDTPAVKDAVEAAGFAAMMTRDDHQSGSDRIFEALNKSDPDGRFDVVINLQGDLPTLDANAIRAVLEPLENLGCDIATLGVEITDEAEKTNPNVVKIVGSPRGDKRMHALYFTRATAPANDGPLYHHIGIYAYRRDALAQFVALPPSVLEQREKLEQLRALEAGMHIDVALIDTVPLGVDTPPDLEKARAILAAAGS